MPRIPLSLSPPRKKRGGGREGKYAVDRTGYLFGSDESARGNKTKGRVLNRCMVEKKGHALAIMSSPASLRKLPHLQLVLVRSQHTGHTYRRRNINRIKFRTPLLLIAMWDRICDH